MGTIYFNVETLSYKIQNWDRAVSFASIQTVDPQRASVLPMSETAWTCILPYLGERAINMRRVCAFFLQPRFDEAYKASPLTPEGVVYRNMVLRLILRAKCQLTNRALYFRPLPIPSDLGIAQKKIRSEHWDRVINQMPLCQSIGPIYSSEVKALAELESLHMQSVDITETVLLDILKRAKNLEDLTFHYPAGSMPKLKVFGSKESSYRNDCFNQEQMISILKAAPNLEQLNVPDRYLFVLNLFETGALLNLRKVDFWYKSVTPDVRARLVEVIQRVAPSMTIDKSNG